MKNRGPRPVASLGLPDLTSIETVARPDSPYDLTDEQAREWWAVVERLPADWFPRESHALLAMFCRHIVAARHVAQLITAVEKAKKLDLARYNQLLIMQEREGRAISALATKMRLAQVSTMRHERAHKPAMVDAPWSYSGEESQ